MWGMWMRNSVSSVVLRCCPSEHVASKDTWALSFPKLSRILLTNSRMDTSSSVGGLTIQETS